MVFKSWHRKCIFLFPETPRPALGSTEPPIEFVPLIFLSRTAAGAWPWPLTSITIYLHLTPWLQVVIEYKQNIVKHTQLILLRRILTLFLSTTCFDSRYEPSSGWLLFLSNAKYTSSKNSKEISVTFRSRKIYIASNTVNGADLGGGGDGVWSQYFHHSMDFKATDVTTNRQKLLKVTKHFQISQ